VYTQAKNILGNIDHGINVGRTVFSVLQPYIEQLGQNHINKNAMKALTYYDDIKKRVVDTHDKAENSLNDITDKLKRKNIMF
jgi:pyrimidine operon attenuation protein/uracil phosphoribosyltransferase